MKVFSIFVAVSLLGSVFFVVVADADTVKQSMVMKKDQLQKKKISQSKNVLKDNKLQSQRDWVNKAFIKGEVKKTDKNIKDKQRTRPAKKALPVLNKQRFNGPSDNVSNIVKRKKLSNTLKLNVFDERVSSSIKSAKAIMSSRGITAANVMFKQAVEKAGSKADKAKAQLIWANTLIRSVRFNPKKAELKQQAVELYRASLPSLQGAAKQIAYNNLGSVLLRQGKPQEALKALQTIKPEFADDAGGQAEHARYLFNLGRAFEKNKNYPQAYGHYVDASLADISFKSASRAALRLYRNEQLPRRSLGHTLRLLDALATRASASQAKAALKYFFHTKKWQSQAGMEKALGVLIRYFTAAKVGPNDFVAVWREALEVTPEAFKRTGNIAQEIIGVYEAKDYTLNFRRFRDLERIKTLGSVATEKDLAAFILQVGDGYLSQHQPTLALQRYAMAWRLSDKTMAAAVRAASTLLNHAKDIPGSDGLDKRLIHSLFAGKARRYANDDWPGILQFHLVIGSFYAKRQIWGDQHDFYGAIKQFNLAIQAHERLSRRYPDKAGKIAGVKLELAVALTKAGQRDLATSRYLDAAKTALKEGDSVLATQSVQALNKDGFSLSRKQQRLLANIESRI